MQLHKKYGTGTSRRQAEDSNTHTNQQLTNEHFVALAQWSDEAVSGVMGHAYDM
jgi:hypothetical protein